MSTILIACERESEQQVLEHALSTRGYRVLKSRDGIEALEIARNDQPGLVLSNVALPRMDGFALFRKFKQDEQLQIVPFIFYSPKHNDPKYERFAMELGAKRFIPGALKAELVLNVVDEVLAAAAKDSQPVSAEPGVAPKSAAVKATTADETQIIRLQLSERLLELESLQDKLARTARFSRLFELNPAAMWLVEKEGGAMLAVNDAALALFGYTRPEFLALNAEGLLTGGESATFGATTVITYRHKDGRVLSLLTVSKDVDFDARGAELLVAHDLSYRIRAERKLVDEAQRLRALFAAVPEGYCVLDRDGRILEANDRYCELSGYSRDELLRLTLADLESQASASDDGHRYQALHQHKDGSRWPADISAAMLDAASGRKLLLIRTAIQPAVIDVPPTHRDSRLVLVMQLLRDCADLDETTLVQQVLPPLARAFDSGTAAWGVADKELQNVRFLAIFENGKLQTAPVVGAALPPAWVEKLATDSVVLSNDENSDVAGIGSTGHLRRALIGCAQTHEQEALILLMGNSEGAYDPRDQQDLLALTQILGRSVARKRNSAQTLAALHRADVAVQAMVDLLCRMVDQHDPHTAGSSNRLAALAVSIARGMGLGGEQQHTVYLAARLHDLGNVAIPKEILGRPLLLGEHELALVRTHAEQGAKLLAGIELGGEVAEVVRQHHERLDGSGYPRGMKQAEIMLEARIVAVADVVEAMCSSRPHRQALGIEAALAEIANGSGSLYDADAAAVCIRLFKEDGFQWPR